VEDIPHNTFTHERVHLEIFLSTGIQLYVFDYVVV